MSPRPQGEFSPIRKIRVLKWHILPSRSWKSRKRRGLKRQKVNDFYRAAEIRGFYNCGLVLFWVRFFFANPMRKTGRSGDKRLTRNQNPIIPYGLWTTWEYIITISLCQKGTRPSQTCPEGYTFPATVLYRGVSLYLGSAN